MSYDTTPTDDDGFEYGWPSAPPAPPTERDGFHVGDHVVLVGFMGSEWPADIVAFTQLPCDMVVRWTGLRPGFTDLATICRKQLREITLGASA